MAFTAPEVIQQLNQARELAFSSKEMFPQVLRQILNFVNNPEPSIKLWCAVFLKDAFQSNDSILSTSDKVDLAIDAIDGLITLSLQPDVKIFDNVINTTVVVYKLVFKYVSDNDGSTEMIWNKLNQLKLNLVSKFKTTYPLEPTDSVEHDLTRNLLTKIELIKFMGVIIDYQTKSNSDISKFNANFINSSHSLIKKGVIQSEAIALLDDLLLVFDIDILIAPLLSAVLTELTVVIKRKHQFVPKILKVIEQFDTTNKLQSNYQTLDEFKLTRKYVDRLVRIFINHLLKYELVPPNFQQSFNQKLQILIERGDSVRRKNILLPSEKDALIKKKKFEGFLNATKTLEDLDYKSLYCLIDPKDELANFDLSLVPQHHLIAMTLAALKRADPNRLNKALDIISDRYKNALETGAKRRFDDPDESRKKFKFDGELDEEDDEFTKEVYNLPPPKELSYNDRKQQINLIIHNFFAASKVDIREVEQAKDNGEDNDVNQQLTRIAIKHWGKKSWLTILTRLATRGMKPVNYLTKSIDDEKNDELSDMIRTAIFDFFLEDIHSRIDIIIEWLNEEWYSEVVNGELVAKNSIHKEVIELYEKGEVQDLDKEIFERTKDIKVKTPVYNKWCGKVLDAIIPFLESNDRKIFIRLLSDLPFLNEELVARIKSLCLDPVRIKLGFLSLQYLIMYRPPVKEGCIGILEELQQSDQQDLKDEAGKLLAKYK